MKFASWLLGCAAACALAVPSNATTVGQTNSPFKHVVIIYEENHSFDNLFGAWDSLNGDTINGLKNAKPAQKNQKRQDGTAFNCLPQNDVNLTSPPLAASCTDSGTPPVSSAFTNGPFKID